MGTDIHFYVEKFDRHKWQSADTWKTECEGETYPYITVAEPFYDSRNYDLFAILADVRNGHGFAGVKTGGGFNPISEPRGLPDDVSDQVAKASEGNHTPSWLTLREILDFDWTQRTEKQGWATLAAWVKWWPGDEGGPYPRSAGVSGGDVRHIPADEMRELVKRWRDATDRDAFLKRYPSTYALAEWTASYAACVAGEWWNFTVPRLLKLAGGIPGAEQVRIVFSFDS
jgi:hypothetical protein